MNLQACPHWSRYAVRQIGEDYYVLFQCDSPAPGPEEHGRGDLPKAKDCLLGMGGELWLVVPIIGRALLRDGVNTMLEVAPGRPYITLPHGEDVWPKALAAFHAQCDKLEESCRPEIGGCP